MAIFSGGALIRSFIGWCHLDPHIMNVKCTAASGSAMQLVVGSFSLFTCRERAKRLEALWAPAQPTGLQ